MNANDKPGKAVLIVLFGVVIGLVVYLSLKVAPAAVAAMKHQAAMKHYAKHHQAMAAAANGDDDAHGGKCVGIVKFGGNKATACKGTGSTNMVVPDQSAEGYFNDTEQEYITCRKCHHGFYGQPKARLFEYTSEADRFGC